jgi:hypothetical protein
MERGRAAGAPLMQKGGPESPPFLNHAANVFTARRTEAEPPVPDYERTFTTTRRFCARPALVLFGATGLSSP